MLTALETRAAPRLLWVEWTRGIAALIVVIHHFLEVTVPAYEVVYADVVNAGRVGVVTFFLVSGYVIPLSYRRQSTRTFLIRRVSRLYPSYLLVLAVFTALYYRPGADLQAWVIMVLLNITMLHQFFVGSIIGVGWTLTIEWVFYAQQMGAKLLRRLDSGWVMGYAWTLVTLAAVLLEMRFTGRLVPLTFPLMLSLSCLGHALSLVSLGVLEKKHAVRMAVFQAAVTTGALLLRGDREPLWGAQTHITSIALGCLLFAACYWLRDTGEHSLLVWLGSISYALYLAHPLFVAALTSFPQQNMALSVVAGIAGSVLAAWLLHTFVEQPFIRIGRAATAQPR